MLDEIGIRLSIISDTMSASHLDEYLGMKSDQSHVRGEMNSLGTKLYERHAWFLKSRYEVSANEQIGSCLATQVDIFLAKLEPISDKVRSLSKEHYVEFSLYLYARDIPPIELSRSQMESVAGLGAALDIDAVLYKAL
jgi:hypothetical protein